MLGTVEQMISDMKHGVYDLTDNGRCTGCGNCCSNVLPITNKEMDTIGNYIKVHHIKECKHPMGNAKYDMTCPFLDTTKSNKKCTIYPVRPYICKTFICDRASHGYHFVPHGNYNVVYVREYFFSE